MHLICLDLEGVLIPEIWISFAEYTGIAEFRKTTRDEPDYNKLMLYRLDLLSKNKLKLPDIKKAIGTMDPLPGAGDFLKKLRERTQVIILSDTFQEFASPLMKKLDYPTLFCNSFVTSDDGTISDYKLRQEKGKKSAVLAFKSLGFKVFASGDSYNDIEMLLAADSGCLFRSPKPIREAYPQFPCAESFEELDERIGLFLAGL